MLKIVNNWTIENLREHLLFAVNLEFWTIPYYLAAYYSIQDRGSEAAQYILAVANQEMLHVQLAANLANAYGADVAFPAPLHQGTTIPHLDFGLDWPNPTIEYSPYSAEIGAADLLRYNTMCLIEYPEWGAKTPDPQVTDTVYGSIGEFYQAVAVGAAQLASHIQGNRNQVDLFSRFYRDFKTPIVTLDGEAGLAQVSDIVACICSQGEGSGRNPNDPEQVNLLVAEPYRNTADDPQPSWPHYWKFKAIRDGRFWPATYPVQTNPPTPQGQAAQARLQQNFSEFLTMMDHLFAGKKVEDFAVRMVTLGGNILACWQNQAVPTFVAAPTGLVQANAAQRPYFPPFSP